jgi:ubiquinone/menaquinone biosynthesis C-methylase UbiE
MEEGNKLNPLDDASLASRYDEWYSGEGRRADALEKELLQKLLGTFPNARSVLEVGCGTGHFTRWMAKRNLNAVGLDISEAMLREARRLGGGPAYLRGNALFLPIADRSHDLTALITTLEFLPDPARALSEAVRVARQGAGGVPYARTRRQGWNHEHRHRRRTRYRLRCPADILSIGRRSWRPGDGGIDFELLSGTGCHSRVLQG